MLGAPSLQTVSSPRPPEGLAETDWSSIRAAYQAGRHAIREVDGGWQTANPGQGWSVRFEGRGFRVRPNSAAWEWGLTFVRYGYGDRQTEIDGTPAVQVEGQRLSYQWSNSVQEWFVNDSRGIEHGFTLRERPTPGEVAAIRGIPLSLTLAVQGGLSPSVTPDALTVQFRDAASALVLTYSGLKVWDADGRILASRFDTAGNNEVQLVIEEGDAKYPITIDPIAQQAYLKSGNNGGPTDDLFGWDVAVSGDTMVVGAPQEDSGTRGGDSAPDEGATNSGAAYVFIRTGATWTQQAYLKAGNCGSGDLFGRAVAIAGDTIVIGAHLEDSSSSGLISSPNESAIDSGAAYVFTRSGTNWTQQGYLKAANIGDGDQFGHSVSVSGDTIVVGALNEDGSGTGAGSTPNEGASNSGAAYVFKRSGSTWSQQAYLKAGNSGAGDWFGISVSVSGDTVVAGAYDEDSSSSGVNSIPNENAAGSGAAYVFTRSGAIWSQQAYLKASNGGGGDRFGVSVAVDGNTLVVGASSEDSSVAGVNGTPDDLVEAAGAAYVFVRNGEAWSQQAYLKSSHPGRPDMFGGSVSVSGDTVAIGARGEASNTTGINGLHNDWAGSSGAAYVFKRSGVAWSQEAFIKSGNSATSDVFGQSVSVSGDTVVSGAHFEDSSTIGVNSVPDENSSGSGAAYVFSRNGNSWNQQAYLKASNTPSNPGVQDNFGAAVAISGDTVVVGAPREDSGSDGVNSIPDETASDAGAAYVFVRSGTTWSQQAYLKASNSGSLDFFGKVVAVSGDIIVVGAEGEDSTTSGINGPPNESAWSSGAAYIFVRNGTVWSQQAFLKPGKTSEGDNFGCSVAVSGHTVVVGALGEDSSTTGVNSDPNESSPSSGAAYVFTRVGNEWAQQAFLKASNTGSEDWFGFSASISGDTLVVGAFKEDSGTTGVNSTPDESASSSGAAYVFTRSGTLWSQQAYLKASNPGAEDCFGSSVSVSSSTVVVGSPCEDTSISSSSPNELANSSGAAYVFVRSGPTWSQKAFLKAGNSKSGDQFGGSVSVSGDTLIVGASRENGGSMTNPAAAKISDSGAAYAFVRSGLAWSQQAYLKAGNPGTIDYFGISACVSGDTVVVGASFEDGGRSGVNNAPDELATDSGAAYVFTGLGVPPRLLSMTPAAGPTAGGTPVLLSGTGFTEVVAVAFNGVPAASFTPNSDNTAISAVTPPHAAGPVIVTVTSATGTSAESIVFTYGAPEMVVEQPPGNELAGGALTVDFGAVLTNAPERRDFVIRNIGNLPLDGLEATVAGANGGDFVAGLPPTSVMEGGSATVTVTFTPSANGGRSAFLRISDDTDGDPVEISLIGSGSTARQLFDDFSAAAGLGESDAEPGATPFHDGVPNLLKYAFGLNAAGPDRRTLVPGTGAFGLPVLSFVSGASPHFRYELVRRKHSGLNYSTRETTSLAEGEWQNVTGTSKVTDIDAVWERVVIEQPYEPGVSPRRFLTTVVVME